MKDTTANIIIICGLVAFLALLWFVAKPADAPQESTVTTEETEVRPVTFTAGESNESVTVTFNADTAVLNGAGFTDIVLTATPAASGAKYENSEQGVTLWNKGQEVTIYKGEETVFTGSTISAVGNDDMSASLKMSSWVWKETVMNDDTTITPKKADAFTLTFTEEGMVQGTTDCNNFTGQYSVEGTTLTMGPLAMTRMYCEGSQEAEFVKMLSEPLGFMVTENGQLVLMLPVDSGSVIFNKK